MTNTDQHLGTAPAIRPRIPPFAFVLTASIGVIGSNSLALGPMAPEVAAGLGTDVPSVMIASAAFGLGTAAAAVFLGRLVDRYGPQRMLLASLCLFACGLAISSVAPTVAVLVAAQLLVGIAAGVALPAIYTLAAVVAPAGRESETIGVVLTGWTLSMVAGVSLAAVVADFVGWRAVYAVVAAVTLVVALTVAVVSPRAAAVSAAPASSPFSALAIPGAAWLLAACGCFMASFYGVYAYLGDHLHEGLGLPLSANGLVALCYGLGFGAAAFLDRLVDRVGPGRLLPPIFLAVAVVFAAMAAASGSYAALLAVVFVWGLINHFGLNVLIMRLTSLDPARRGAIMGLNSGVTYLALFAGTIGFGRLHAAFGFAVLPTAAVALMLAAALLAAIAAPARKCPEARTASRSMPPASR